MTNIFEILRVDGTQSLAELVLVGALPHHRIGGALLRVAPGAARAEIATLPVLSQAAVVRTQIRGGEEAAVLTLLAPGPATSTIMIDASLFGKIGLLHELRGNLSDVDLGQIEARLEGKSFLVTTSSGEEKRVALEINPERAWVYLRTIIRAEDAEWRDEILELLGEEFVAFVVACHHDGEIEIDDDEWDQLRELFGSMLGYFSGLARTRGREALEIDLLEQHARATNEHFGLADAGLELVRGSADDLVHQLNLDD